MPANNIELFEEQTTYKSDYKKLPIRRVQSIKTNQERVERLDINNEKRLPFRLRDNETLYPWNVGTTAPFDTFGFPKPIVGCDPRKPFKLLETETTKDVRRIIPRAKKIFAPAVSLDEVADDATHKILLNYTYTTAMKASQEEFPFTRKWNLNIPDTLYNPRVEMKKYVPQIFPDLKKKNAEESMQWDAVQHRTLGDPDLTFWGEKVDTILRGKKFQDSDLLPQDMKNEIHQLVTNNELALPYDNPMKGYAGHNFVCALGVPLKDRELKEAK